MPRGATIQVENNFTKGLITEFTAMNFPENAITEGENCVFSELGSVTRRLGMDYEEDSLTDLLSTYTSLPNCFTEFEWSSVAQNGTTTFLVQQVGEKLLFFSSDAISLSWGIQPFFVDISQYRTTGTTITEVSMEPCQFTSGKGLLFVVHPLCDPFYVEYDPDTVTVSSRRITIQVRDFEGVDDGLEISTRPTTLSNLHKYNLYNQGWYYDALVFIEGTGGNPTKMNVLEGWDLSRADFPSNADYYWVYKGTSEEAYFGDIINDFHRGRGMVGPAQITLGNTPAPRGHYIYSAFNINRTSMTGISGLPSESAGRARPSCIAWFAGRTFYAGTSKDGFADKIYFTQIIESDTQLGKCYQINDPTSEILFDLLDSDGGVIILPTIERIVSMKVVNDALIVIGTNGTFAIRGTENGPFRATDYTVEYVSPVGGVSNLSVVEVNPGLMWWNYDGLYALGKDQVGVFFQVQNISKQSIQSVLDDVPPPNKPFVKGAFNKKDQLVHWLYSDSLAITRYKYNSILAYNRVSDAFYIHSISTLDEPEVVGIVSLEGSKNQEFEAEVTVEGEVVTDSNLDEVYVFEEAFVPNVEVFKYTTSGPIRINGSQGITYSELHDEGYVDWETSNQRLHGTSGRQYLSYFVSGYRIRGEFLRSFNSTPIAVLVKNIVGGQILMSGLWDYNLRQTTVQQIYRSAISSVGYIIRRIKLRGKGKSLQLKFESSGTAPFEVVGWSTFDSGGQQP